METFSRETLEPAYVTGFVERGGAFTYSRSGRQLSLYFAIKLGVADQPILEAIQTFFGGIGKIYEVRRATADRAAAYYRVSHRADLPRIVSHFDAHPLRTTKRDIYETWRLMVLAKQDFRNPDRKRLDELANEISMHNRSSS